jgi:hypothetical protein
MVACSCSSWTLASSLGLISTKTAFAGPESGREIVFQGGFNRRGCSRKSVAIGSFKVGLHRLSLIRRIVFHFVRVLLQLLYVEPVSVQVFSNVDSPSSHKQCILILKHLIPCVNPAIMRTHSSCKGHTSCGPASKSCKSLLDLYLPSGSNRVSL